MLSGEKLAELGLSDTRSLNIEGMHLLDDQLLLGLKSPVNNSGHALIWRISDPEQLLTSGRLGADHVSLWGQVKLQVVADGQAVAGGISDLLVLPDKRLLVGATASGMKPRQQTGSLWVIPDAKKGVMPSVRIKQFTGLKPEGLALSPDGDRVVVVFDQDSRVPRWREIPIPAK